MSRYIKVLATALTLFGSSSSSIFIGSSDVHAQTACTATTTTAIADKIANGHSWGKHGAEYPAGTVIAGLAMPASPRVTTVAEFKALIQGVIGSSTNKTLVRGRKAYWGSPTGTIVVYDPNSVDCGTAFRPVDGKPYYDRQS